MTMKVMLRSLLFLSSSALSQASFIHVRDGRNAIPHGIFNEVSFCAEPQLRYIAMTLLTRICCGVQSYMLHSTTSPLYAIAASNDIAASMMDHGGGKTLTDESIREVGNYPGTEDWEKACCTA